MSSPHVLASCPQAYKVKNLYPSADLRLIPSGHCPHDDSPEITNRELISWLKALPDRPLATQASGELCIWGVFQFRVYETEPFIRPP